MLLHEDKVQYVSWRYGMIIFLWTLLLQKSGLITGFCDSLSANLQLRDRGIQYSFFRKHESGNLLLQENTPRLSH